MGQRTAAAIAPATVNTLTPARLLDTRSGEKTIDGKFAGGGLRPAGSTLELQVAGRGGIDPSPSAVSLNVTVTEPSAPGFVTVWPCGSKRPTASNVNYTPGQTVANAVITAVGDAGRVCFFTFAPTHLVVDATAWFSGDAFSGLETPARFADTRVDASTIDGRFAGAGTRPSGSTLELAVAGRAGLASDVSSVVLNVTATEPAAPGFVTVWPCGQQRPTASNVNYLAGKTVPNLVVSAVGAGGRVCFFTSAATHLVVDVAGALLDDVFETLPAPRRVFESRAGEKTYDGLFAGAGVQRNASTLQLTVAGRVGIPANASAVMLNLTTVLPSAPGFLTTHPRGTERPNASNANYAPGDVVANATIAPVGAGGQVCVFTLASTHMVIDVAGWFTGPPPPSTGQHCPVTPAANPGAVNGIVRRPVLQRTVGLDRIAVIACVLPNDESYGGTPSGLQQLATWANGNVAPWFRTMSRGAYTQVFEPHPLGQVAADGNEDCRDKAAAATGPPFTNVVAVSADNADASYGNPGRVTEFDVGDQGPLARSPRESRRGAVVNNGVFGTDFYPNLGVWVHEIGHTVHWPHSYVPKSSSEYTNVLDVMSADLVDVDVGVTVPGCVGDQAGCWAQGTLAFNRFASGWVPDDRVAVHWAGRANYKLDAPGGAGTQLVAAVSTVRSDRLITLEARPRAGYDRFNEKGGVAIHFVEQAETAPDSCGSCWWERVSTSRRQAPVVGGPYSVAHVLGVGESITVRGLTVDVLAKSGDGYLIAVAGAYTAAAATVPY